MNGDYSLTRDPIFFITVGFLALLLSAIPAAFGQSWLLPTLQTLALTIFVSMALRQGNPGSAIGVLVMWIIIQGVIIALLSVALPEQMERTIANGFDRRMAFVEWVYTGSLLPDSWGDRPFGRIFELFAATLGSLATGGLLGIWIIVRVVNSAAFYAGSLAMSTREASGFFIGLPIWTVLRIAGYVGLTLWFAEPMHTRSWSFQTFWQQRRRLLWISTALLLLGLLLELVIPNLWRGWIVA